MLIENESFRFDSEYFKKEYLESIKTLKSKRFLVLEQDAVIKGGKRLPLDQSFSDNGVPYIRAEDNKYLFVAHDTAPKISEKLSQTLAAYQIKFNDILITIVGNSIGDIGIVKFELKKCNLTENCAKVTKLKSLNPHYLLIFLNSTFGILQIKRESVGTAQPKLALERIRKFKILIVSNEFQTKIENVVGASHSKLQKSKSLYTEAEQLLLQELGLVNFKPSTENIAIKKLSESFGTTGRLDAEYYQPKYEEILERVKGYPNSWGCLGEIANIEQKICQLDGKIEYKYIELSNVGNFGEITDYTLGNGKELPSRARRLVKTSDVIVSSIEGSLSSVALIEQVYNNAICSTGFYVINSKLINSETLLLLIKSQICQTQLKKVCSGTILTAINSQDFKNIIIPLIDTNIQNIIASKIQQSFALRKESKHLLDIAKQAVEMAIEEDEETAIKWLNEVTIPETNIHEKS